MDVDVHVALRIYRHCESLRVVSPQFPCRATCSQSALFRDHLQQEKQTKAVRVYMSRLYDGVGSYPVCLWLAARLVAKQYLYIYIFIYYMDDE